MLQSVGSALFATFFFTVFTTLRTHLYGTNNHLCQKKNVFL